MTRNQLDKPAAGWLPRHRKLVAVAAGIAMGGAVIAWVLFILS